MAALPPNTARGGGGWPGAVRRTPATHGAAASGLARDLAQTGVYPVADLALRAGARAGAVPAARPRSGRAGVRQSRPVAVADSGAADRGTPHCRAASRTLRTASHVGAGDSAARGGQAAALPPLATTLRRAAEPAARAE